MAIYVTEQEYADYFSIDLSEVPEDFDRLELLSIVLFETLFPIQLPEDLSTLPPRCEESVKYALLEQIYKFANEPETVDGVSTFFTSFSIGRYSAQQGETYKVDELSKKLSSNAYMFLARCGFIYQGLGTCPSGIRSSYNVGTTSY